MGGKKLTLVILVVLGGVAFATSYLVFRHFTGPQEAQGGTKAKTEGIEKAASPEEAAAAAATAAAQEIPRVDEKHLYELIKEVRQKIRECDKRQVELDEQDKRILITKQTLGKEAQELENLRVQLGASVTRVKEAQAQLDKTRINIDREEVVNLKRTAAVYDKMDSAAGGRILEGMCANQQEADAVKLLRYMSERTVAKILAEITDKAMAARLCEQMNRIREQTPVKE